MREATYKEPMKPCFLLRRWLELAQSRKIVKADAFCLSTINFNAAPCSRMMLANKVLDDGVVFCTDERSNKISNLFNNSNAAAVMYWPALNRQVRIEGKIEPLDDSFAEEDFQKKSRAQQLLITICAQSANIKHHQMLEQSIAGRLNELGEAQAVSRPKHWRAYFLRASQIEYFIGGKERLNKRVLLTLSPSHTWKATHLFP